MIKSSNKQWTFGIISTDIIFDDNGFMPNTLYDSVQSIQKLNIPKEDYEIIIVGKNSLDKDVEFNGIKFITFDEDKKPKWITKKKNIIIDNALYENLIIIHDYVSFDNEWYKGFQNFDTEWDVCMCKIYNNDGIRWRDWILWWCAHAPYRLEYNGVLLPPNRLLYDDTRFINSDMYINGTVIIGKKNFLIKNKFNEELVWGQGEDCEWSQRCRPYWKYKMNTNSKLRLLKQHDSNT